jgi:hypothetical protein
VFRWDDDWYLMPETAQATRLEMYKANSFPYRWELHTTLMDDVEIVDATIERIGDYWWLFATISEGGEPAWDSLHLFHSSSPLGPWQRHTENPVKVDVRSSRPAGRLFKRRGRWYRPAQDCSSYYGYRVVINRIDQISPHEFHETPVGYWQPDAAHGAFAQHTVNSVDGLSVLDFQIRRHIRDPGGRRAPSVVQPHLRRA